MSVFCVAAVVSSLASRPAPCRPVYTVSDPLRRRRGCRCATFTGALHAHQHGQRAWTQSRGSFGTVNQMEPYSLLVQLSELSSAVNGATDDTPTPSCYRVNTSPALPNLRAAASGCGEAKQASEKRSAERRRHSGSKPERYHLDLPLLCHQTTHANEER